jgi:predicted tellurium resistance membrane protein TerC
MSPDPGKKPTQTERLLLVVVGLAIAIILFRFLDHLFNEGWEAASKAVPAGKVLIFIILAIAVYLLGPWLMDQGYRATGMVVICLVAGLVGITFIAAIPSCGNPNSSDLPYYRR